MADRPVTDVRLELWSSDDLRVLERNNTRTMTEHLGGPEPSGALRDRHDRYLRLNASGEARMFTIRVAEQQEPVGSVGYWKTQWDDHATWDAGWAVHTAHQGRGYATAAVKQVLRDAVGRDPERHLVYADPLTTNPASNALCSRLGFEFRQERDVEFSAGRVIHVNLWVYDLRRLEDHPSP